MVRKKQSQDRKSGIGTIDDQPTNLKIVLEVVHISIQWSISIESTF